MSIRYCLTCRHTLEDAYSLVKGASYFCPACQQALVYFGAEPVSLSEQALLDEYDALHSFDPVRDYQGVYKHYESGLADARLLECEDCLKHDPKNREALVYLATDSWSKGLLEKSVRYCETLLGYYSLKEGEIKLFMRGLFGLKRYDRALEVLDQMETVLPAFYVGHHRAMATMGLRRFDVSLQFFYEAHTLCKSDSRKAQIKHCIRQITGYLEKKG